MHALLDEIRHNPLLWLLVFVPVVFVGETLAPEAHTLLFALSVLAIVPLAALLSHATESVAAKTGDTVGGLLNATLGNLTELVIAITALRAGQYMLVKASIAGAIVTNTLFMLGASFLLGGLKHHAQSSTPRTRACRRASCSWRRSRCWFRRRCAGWTSPESAAFTQTLSVCLAVLLIATYGLGLLFSLKTHREFFGAAEPRGSRRRALADRRGAGDARRRHGAGGAGQRGLRRVGAGGGLGARDEPGVRRLHRRGAGGRRRGDGVGLLGGAQGPAGPQRRHRARERGADRACSWRRCWCC